ncbi:hypothetical protein ACQZV8_18165 [Magnetococcales bacterium HHB-1]
MSDSFILDAVKFSFPLASIDSKTAAELATYYEKLARELRKIAESDLPVAARQQVSKLRAKQIREAAWLALRLEQNGLDTEEALLHAVEQSGFPEWVLRSAMDSNRTGYLTHHRDTRDKLILEMSKGGMNNSQIGEHLNLHRSTIGRILGKHQESGSEEDSGVWTRPEKVS